MPGQYENGGSDSDGWNFPIHVNELNPDRSDDATPKITPLGGQTSSTRTLGFLQPDQYDAVNGQIVMAGYYDDAYAAAQVSPDYGLYSPLTGSTPSPFTESRNQALPESQHGYSYQQPASFGGPNTSYEEPEPLDGTFIPLHSPTGSYVSQEEQNPYLYRTHTVLGTTKPPGDRGGLQVSAQDKKPTFENQVDLPEAYRHKSRGRNRRAKNNTATGQADGQEDTDLVYPPSVEGAEDINLTQQYGSVREFVLAQLAAHEGQIPNVHAPDATIPRTDMQRKKLVRQLVAAMTYIGDDVNKKDVKENDSQAVTKIKSLTATTEGWDIIEKVAWEVLLLAVEAQEGKKLLAGHHGLFEEEYETFEHRWVQILRTAHTEKNVVKSQMDAFHRHRLASRPGREQASRGNNKKLNGRRNNQIRLAIRVEKSGKKLEDFPAPDENEEANDVATLAPANFRSSKKAKFVRNSRAAQKDTSEEQGPMNRQTRKRYRESMEDDAIDGTPIGRSRHTRNDSGIADMATPHRSTPSAPSPLNISTRNPKDLDLEEVENLLNDNPGNYFAEKELSTRYRGIICTILGTDPLIPWKETAAAALTLGEVRAYAWSRTPSLQGLRWYYTRMRPKYGYCVGDTVYLSDGSGSIHLSEALPALKDVFIERGELTKGGTDAYFIQQRRFIRDERTSAENRALGLAPNPLGVIVFDQDGFPLSFGLHEST